MQPLFGETKSRDLVSQRCYTSADPTWATPQGVFDELDQEFGFTLDVCASAENAKCARFFTEEDDALSKEWKGVCFMNPPYGYGIGAWVRKAYESALEGVTVVCLLPARTDTAWFHDYCLKGEVRFIRGRLKFEGGRWNAPFPSCIVIFRRLHG